ncbi:MAG: exo-alpha-sialidase [Clostridia bacterium]|nr:exo-alpha-sialidase [Clostridia bacterium]
MGEVRYMHCTPVYTDGVRRLNQVERLPDGRLFTIACFGKVNQGGHFSKEPVSQYIMGRVSEDEGKTWKGPTFFYELPDRDPMVALAAFMIDRDGRIHAFFMRINNIDWHDTALLKGDISYMRMDDEQGRNLIYKKIEALDRYTGSMNNLIQLDSGRIVAPFSTIPKGGGALVSSVVYSDDGGDTWRASNDVSVVNDDKNIESGAVEPVVVQAAPGVLVMLIRTVLDRIWYSVSYDEGASWCQAKPTLIPSSNAPSVPLSLEGGRILLCWNDVLGEPMYANRSSYARQCLYAAVSGDGLKTLQGVRMIARKRACDPDDVQNCYPFASHAGNGEVYLRPFSVFNDGVQWGEPQGTLLRLRPDDLLEMEMTDRFEEWVTDCPVDEAGIHMRPTKSGVAYACVNFPYATEGEITVHADRAGALKGAKLILSDCYLDRLTFLPEKLSNGHANVIGKPYVEAELPAGSDWQIAWNSGKLEVSSTGGAQTVSLAEWGRGFNHLILLFEGEGELNIRSFGMKALCAGMGTGIEY